MSRTNPRSSSYDQARARLGRAVKVHRLEQLRFFQVLQAYAKRHPVRLNLPETIIQGFGIKKPTCLRTNSQGLVISREGLSTPDIINLLLTFRAQTRPGIPCAMAKQETDRQDRCMPLLTLKAGQIAWNRTLSQFLPIVIQRFLYNGTPCAFVLRVRYQPPLGYQSFHILQNIQGVVGCEADHYTELTEFLDRSAKQIRITHHFCVRSSSAFTSFEFCPIKSIDSVKVQLEVLRQVLERGFLSQYDLSVLEIEADFCQDSDAKWYFVSLHSYKTELTVKRTIPFSNVQEMMSRLVVSRTVLRSASPSAKSGDIMRLEDADLTHAALVSEILEDLGVRR